MVLVCDYCVISIWLVWCECVITMRLLCAYYVIVVWLLC